MPGVLIGSPPRHTAMKRPAEDTDFSQYHPQAFQNRDIRSTKRARKYHHAIKHRQPAAIQSLEGAQDEVFFQSQLLRSLSLSLSAQGFDAVENAAMEAFRFATDTCTWDALRVA